MTLVFVVDNDDSVGADGNMLIYVCNGGGDVGDDICVSVLLVMGIVLTIMGVGGGNTIGT